MASQSPACHATTGILGLAAGFMRFFLQGVGARIDWLGPPIVAFYHVFGDSPTKID